MYSQAAIAERRCRGQRKDGRPCRRYRSWGDTSGFCWHHGGAAHAEPFLCRCLAYEWGHRPGGGLCRWPEDPIYALPTPAGTHRVYRMRGIIGL